MFWPFSIPGPSCSLSTYIAGPTLSWTPILLFSDIDRHRRKGLDESFLVFKVVTMFGVICHVALLHLGSQLGYMYTAKRFDEIN